MKTKWQRPKRARRKTARWYRLPDELQVVIDGTLWLVIRPYVVAGELRESSRFDYPKEHDFWQARSIRRAREIVEEFKAIRAASRLADGG
jgi:hypothetical protein